MKGTLGRYAILVAILAGFIAAMANMKYIKGLTQMQNVVVVSQNIQPFQMLDETNLTLQSVPTTSVLPETFNKIEDVKGKYTRGLLIKGDRIRKSHVTDASGGSLSTRLTSEGDPAIRAMAIRVADDTGVANRIQAGDTVDILITFKDDKSTMARVIARSVPVLVTPTTKSDSFGGGGSSSASTVVLQVTPTLAEEIAFAQTSGYIWLLLTPYNAAATDALSSGVTTESFLQRYGAMVIDPTKKEAR